MGRIMRNLDITTLRLFVAVCETGSLKMAGEQENLVGSAISKRFAQLEDALGTVLLTRRRRGMVPTQAGETLLEHARAVMANLDSIERDMAGYAGGASGLVQVLCTASVLEESLAHDVAAFLQVKAHRHIHVTMEERVSRGVVQGIHDGVASIGLCWDAVDLGGLAFRPYRPDHLVMVMHPSHPLARRRRLRFEETLDHQQVGLPATTAMQIMLRRIAAEHGKPLVHRVVVSTFDGALRVVHANLAISVVPREIAEIYAGAVGLVMVPLTDEWAERRFVLCFRDEAALSPASRLLVQHLANDRDAKLAESA